jgi:hypothetical protein
MRYSFLRVLHAITTAYHAARQNRRTRRDNIAADKEAHYDGANVNNRAHGDRTGNGLY